LLGKCRIKIETKNLFLFFFKQNTEGGGGEIENAQIAVNQLLVRFMARYF
jgi:hypothetical protein